MDLGLAGKSVIITGAGSNIGRGILFGFAKEGANVVNAEIDEKQGQKAVDQANALGGGGKAILVKTDVTDWDSVQALVKKTIDEFGKVDVLVNNVGYVFERLFIEKPLEECEKEISLNYWSVILCCKAVLDHMVERKYGKIVSIASDAGRMGEYNESVYAGAKAGVIGLSKSIARETGRYGLNINVICPGAQPPKSTEDFGSSSIWTDQFVWVTDEIREKMAKKYPLRRLGGAEDIANAALFLASDAASYITGQTLSVSGGYTMM
jgi:2-hydroxycyclohexanecarboxyl-CoA dehydrogenase